MSRMKYDGSTSIKLRIYRKDVIKIFSNFSYNGVGNDEFGLVCCSFESSAKNVYDGTKTKLNTDISGDGKTFEIYDNKYSEPLQFTIQLINKDGSNIGAEQERYVNRWLLNNDSEYKTLFIQDSRFADLFLFCVFVNPKLITVSDVVGLQYDVITNSSVGFSDLKEYTVEFTGIDKSIDLYLFNDDTSKYVFPYIEITMKESGDLKIINSAETDSLYFTEIKSVSTGEKIILDCDLPDISSSISSATDIWDRFNKTWIRLYDDINTITVSLSCTMEIKYRELRRLGVF